LFINKNTFTSDQPFNYRFNIRFDIDQCRKSAARNRQFFSICQPENVHTFTSRVCALSVILLLEIWGNDVYVCAYVCTYIKTRIETSRVLIKLNLCDDAEKSNKTQPTIIFILRDPRQKLANSIMNLLVKSHERFVKCQQSVWIYLSYAVLIMFSQQLLDIETVSRNLRIALFVSTTKNLRIVDEILNQRVPR
jgi:hypothetical protein